jgi:hypothetical protein
MNAEPSTQRLHVFTALILAGVFVAGGVAGAGLTVLLRAERRPDAPPPRPHLLPPPLRELQLTPDQERRAREVAERYRGEMEAAVQEAFPKVRAVQERMDADLRALLTPEQAARFDELRARRPPGPFPMGPRMHGPPPGDGAAPPPPPPGERPPGGRPPGAPPPR